MSISQEYLTVPLHLWFSPPCTLTERYIYPLMPIISLQNDEIQRSCSNWCVSDPNCCNSHPFFSVLFWCTFKDTYGKASLHLICLGLLTLDRMTTASINHQLNQEQEKMMLANNIITALVHISLIWQKLSFSSVSHMGQCCVIERMGKHKISYIAVVSVIII